jgi:hypothetical protein
MTDDHAAPFHGKDRIAASREEAPRKVPGHYLAPTASSSSDASATAIGARYSNDNMERWRDYGRFAHIYVDGSTEEAAR